MIDTKDLMIGNYVKVNFGLGEGEIFKVERICNNNHEGWIDLFNDSLSEGYTVGHSTKQLDPITLTEDFLIKNEFVYQKDDNSYTLFDDYYSINAKEVNDGMWQIVVEHCEIFNDIEVCSVSYVHQLQQFLNLCGIELNIKL